MLDIVFGFNARLGRLQFFLSTIALAVVMTAICFAIFASGSIHVAKGAQLSWGMLGWPLLGAALFFMVASFMLQAMRVRDIGWDPVLVVGGWIAISVINAIVAMKLPALSQSVGAMTGLVNLGMFGVLYFWPGSDS